MQPANSATRTLETSESRARDSARGVGETINCSLNQFFCNIKTHFFPGKWYRWKCLYVMRHAYTRCCQKISKFPFWKLLIAPVTTREELCRIMGVYRSRTACNICLPRISDAGDAYGTYEAGHSHGDFLHVRKLAFYQTVQTVIAFPAILHTRWPF